MAPVSASEEPAGNTTDNLRDRLVNGSRAPHSIFKTLADDSQAKPFDVRSHRRAQFIRRSAIALSTHVEERASSAQTVRFEQNDGPLLAPPP
jgi:hypothetical protein